MRLITLTTLAALLFLNSAYGQTNWRFQWKKGQVYYYRVTHHTSATHTVKDNKLQTSSNLKLRKKWEVLDVDASGVATLQYSLEAMRNEQQQFNGEKLLFDSENLSESTPSLAEHLTKYVGKPLAVLRVDSTGAVIEAKVGEKHRYDAEPPFLFTLPKTPVTVGGSWKRNYDVVLAPPQGTGEKYEATQTYTCKSIKGNRATFTLETEFKNLPDSPQERIPLFQKQPSGEIIFDLESGRLITARLLINKRMENIQGQGSNYLFESAFVEDFDMVK